MKLIVRTFLRAFAATLGFGLACYLLLWVGQRQGWLPFKPTKTANNDIQRSNTPPARRADGALL